MDSKILGGLDNRAVLGQLFKTAFGASPVYITVPLGIPKPTKIEGFNPNVKDEFVNEDQILKSVYGTPIIYPVQFRGGDYPIYDWYGKPKMKRYDDLWLPATTMLDFSRPKNIIKTNVLGVNGTVKEVFGFDDWQIRIRMLCLNDNRFKAREYADMIQDWFEIAGGINVFGSIFSKKEIYNIVIENIDIKSVTGSPDVIPIELSAVSNEPVEIFLNKQ